MSSAKSTRTCCCQQFKDFPRVFIEKMQGFVFVMKMIFYLIDQVQNVKIYITNITGTKYITDNEVGT